MPEEHKDDVPSLTVTPALAQLLGIPERCLLTDLWEGAADSAEEL